MCISGTELALTEDMLLARGAIQDRPFGKTVGTIARRGVTGQLTAECDGATYAMVFDRGHLVAATSPNVSDGAAAIALANDLITPGQAATIERWLAAIPDADELAVLGRVTLMTEAELLRLRRRVIAHCAARMVALERGDFVLTSKIAVPVHPDCEMHAGGVIYRGARLFVHDPQLRAIIGGLGSRFELRAEAHDDLVLYGFGEAERPILRALAAGVELAALQELRVEADRRIAMAVIYALASFGALYCEAAASPLRLARGTRNPMRTGGDTTPPAERLSDREIAVATEPLTKSTAEEAFQRAQLALRGDRVDDAIFDLELATQLAPNEPRYFAALAWARFCRAPDKASIANQTRAMLARAIARSDAPVLPHYYLGLVERIMNRPEQALEHFREVLELQPNHPEAATEIRFLSRRG